jgi:hypothetical protein
MRHSTLAAALSLLMLPAASAFADGEGSAMPQAVASPASGHADHRVAAQVIYSQGEGGQSDARPAAQPAGAPMRQAVTSGMFLNLGTNG